MGRKVANPDAKIAKIAARQHGVVSVGQIYGLGLGERAVRVRVDAGRLHRMHRGVYAVGHRALSFEARCIAAVLAVGRGPHDGRESVLGYWGAAVGHRDAASLWGVLPASEEVVEVVVMGDGGRTRRAGIRVHRSRTLVPSAVTLCHRVPVTKAGRTIADLRLATTQGFPGAVSRHQLRKAIRQANVLGLPIEDGDIDRTRGDLEGDFLKICARHRISPPEVNVRIGPYLVDFLWRARRLVVETDSYLHHRGRVAFQEDHGRNLALKRRGYEVLRLSEQQIVEEPDQVAEVLLRQVAS